MAADDIDLHAFRCQCGTPLQVRLYHSANASRNPEIRDLVAADRFHRVVCHTCGLGHSIERQCLYVDLDQELYVGVFPDIDRERLDTCLLVVARSFEGALSDAPPAMRAWAKRVRLRVVFGYDQLREKVLAFQAGLDDRAVEAWKVVHLALNAQWQSEGVVDLELKRLDGDTLVFLLRDAEGQLLGEQRVHRDAIATLARQPLSDTMPGLFDSHFVHFTHAKIRSPGAGAQA